MDQKVTLRPLLLDFDRASLNVEFEIFGSAEKISRIAIFDRTDKLITAREFEPAAIAAILPLGKTPRSRFPLFIEIEESDGTLHDAEAFGPIFPAPTQNGYVGGIRLPIHAVDTVNDPVIRKQLLAAIVGEADKARLDQALKSNDEQVSRVLSGTWISLAIGSIWTAWCLIMLEMPGTTLLNNVCAAIAMVAIWSFPVWLSVKMKNLWDERNSIELDAAEQIRNYDEAVRALGRFGVYRKLLPGRTDNPCRCHDAKEGEVA